LPNPLKVPELMTDFYKWLKTNIENDEETYTKFMFRILNRSMKIAVNMFETKNTENSKLLTISKYAKYKGFPTSTIRYWVEIGKIKPTSYTNSGYMLFDINNKKLQ